jgi:hypothetical protein
MAELLAALESDDLQVRLDAIIKLGELKSVEAVPKLIEMLHDENDLVRMAVISALGDIGHISALRAIIQIAREEEAPMSILAEMASSKILNSTVEQEKSASTPPEPSAVDDFIAEPAPSEIPAEPDLENTIPMKPIDVDVLPPPKPITPAPVVPAQREIDDELEHTGSMEPIDLDEFSASDGDDEDRIAEAEPDAKPAPSDTPGFSFGETDKDLTLIGGGNFTLDDLLRAAEEAAKADSDKKEEIDQMRGGEGGDEPAPEAPPQIPLPAPGALPIPRPQPIAPPRMESENEKSRSREEASPQQPVQFSAYYPREIKPDEWQPLQAYVFKESAADRVLEDAEKQLGPLGQFRRIVEQARQIIREGDTITATPNLPGFQFNPPSASISFFEDWHRFEFKMRAKDAPLNLAANGFLTFTVNGIIVADIPLSVFVTNEVTNSQPQRTPSQPIYETVFASYSHKDTPVVLKVEAAAKAFGMTYLRDVITLRSGEDWSAGLEKMIEDATIFQMFWSPPYSLSQHCKREWEYAVNLNHKAGHFIRPVYWLQPMPDPPTPLQHLHFAYQPDLVK